MLQKLCPKCKRIIPAGKAYCASCQRMVDAAQEQRRAEGRRKASRAYDKRRDPKYTAFYNASEWRTLSHTKMISAGYQCEQCKRQHIISIASEVHHLQPIQTPAGWERRFDRDNLICLCTKCHNEVHGRFSAKRINGSDSER